MIVLPAVILLLAAAVLGTGRRWGPRAARFIEGGAVAISLAVSILLGFTQAPGWTITVDAGIGAGLWEIRFTNAPAAWALQAGLLAWATAAALRRQAEISPGDRERRAAWLVYAAIIGFAVVAGNLLTIILTWAALGVGERMISTALQDSRIEVEKLPLATSTDALVGVLLMGAGGLIAVTSGQPLGSVVPLLALVAACAVRVVAADRTAQKLDPEGRPAGTGVEAAWLGSLPAFALLSWAVPEVGGALFPSSLGWTAGVVALVSAMFLALGSSPIARRRLWIVVWLGLALLVGASDVVDFASVSGGAGVAMVLGSSLFWDRGSPAVSWLRSMTGALLAAGVPFLAGAVVAGRLPGTGVVLMTMATLTMAMTASRSWRDLVPGSGGPPSRSDPLMAGIGLAVVVGASLAVYVRLRGDVIAWLEPVLALVGSVAIAGALRVISPTRLARLERALRWPDLTGVGRLSRSAGEASLRVVRGVRDVLEGDASLLWAFVIVLVAFLMLRGAS